MTLVIRPIQTRFRFGSGCTCLSPTTHMNSPAHSPKGTRSGLDDVAIAPCPPTVCQRTVSDSFHSPHRGSFHLSLTVLFRYRSSRVFSLGGWTPLLHTGLACPVLLRVPARSLCLHLLDSHRLRSAFPDRSIRLRSRFRRPFNPGRLSHRFGLLRFRSPLLAELSLFLRVLRCFTSPGSLPFRDVTLFTSRVSPFGYRRISACTRLPDAFRSVPRPSSALDAQASPVRLLSLLLSCGDLAPLRDSYQLSAPSCLNDGWP
jgi:hypothetical protein